MAMIDCIISWRGAEHQVDAGQPLALAFDRRADHVDGDDDVGSVR